MHSTTLKSLKAKPTVMTERGIERATSILDAARDIATENGITKLSMRSVASRVGISLSNLQHYYATKEELIECLLGYMTDGWQADITKVLLANANAAPSERFRYAIDVVWNSIQDPRTANVLLDVWALASRDKFAAGLVEQLRSREQKAMLQLLREMSGDRSRRDLELRASMIVVVIEGLIVQLACRGLKPATRAGLTSEAMHAVIQLATEFAS